jgi:hypothetical protein
METVYPRGDISAGFFVYGIISIANPTGHRDNRLEFTKDTPFIKSSM